MQNILDYVEWRGDLSFERDVFNEVDNLILSALAYLDFEGIVPFLPEGDIPVLSEIVDKVMDLVDTESPRYQDPFFHQIPELFAKAAKSVRFGGIGLSCYVNRIDYDKSEQFSALVFSLGGGLYYIAFRGTDDSLAGWKEDFQMSFKDEVQAQRDAAAYLKSILPYFEGRFLMGGHSKGGNLAVYAAASMDDDIRERIEAVYNNDGPGFQNGFIRSRGYRSMLGRISTIVPKSSIVGMLLEHKEEYKVVNSDEKGIMQHNVFSWEVRGKNFVYHDHLEKSSINLNRAVKGWLNNLPVEQREQFVEELFNIIYATGAMTVSDLYKERRTAAEEMIRSYKNIDAESRKFLKKTLFTFFRESQKVLKASIETDIDAFKLKRRHKEKTEAGNEQGTEKTVKNKTRAEETATDVAGTKQEEAGSDNISTQKAQD